MAQARLQYQEELAALETRALDGLDLVIETLDRAIEAVEHQDIELAELVIADDDRIDGRYLEIHQSILTLLATQAPVATDLRLISALLHVMKCMERMGDQCVNIAKLIPVAGHDPPADEEMLEQHRHDGQARAVDDLAGQAGVRRARRRAGTRPRAPGRRRRQPQPRLLPRSRSRSATTHDRREWAMTMMLVARAIERTGDNAVDIGEQVAFVVTGLFREFEDASHPGEDELTPQALRVPGRSPATLHEAGAAPLVGSRCAGAARPEFYRLLAEAGREPSARGGADATSLLATWPDGSAARSSRSSAARRRATGSPARSSSACTAAGIAPFDRNDIYALAGAIDDVVDDVEEGAQELAVYRIECPDGAGSAARRVLRDAAGRSHE